MTENIKPITNSARGRAADADPNGRRCLIENCSTQKAIHLTHVLKRESSTNGQLMRSLEWNWGMTKNTLNLDTKGNMFFVGASLHELYKGRKWVLLPEESAVYQYFNKKGVVPLKRAQFPKLEAELYRYTMLPLQDMDDIYITRQSMDPDSAKGITIHDYPFETLPILIFHISPRYAIIQVGDVVYSDLPISDRRALLKKYPILRKIDTLYTRWTASLSQIVEKDKQFVPAPPSVAKNSESSGNSVCTPMRRILPIRVQKVLRPTYPASSSTVSRILPPSPDAAATPHKSQKQSSQKKRTPEAEETDYKRGKSRRGLLTFKALEELDGAEDSEDSDRITWTLERISAWAEVYPDI